MRAGLAVADVGAGMYAAMGILMAGHRAPAFRPGQWVQASLLHSLIAMLDFQVARYLNEGDCRSRWATTTRPARPWACTRPATVRSTWARRARAPGSACAASGPRGPWSRCPNTAREAARAQPGAMLNDVLAPIFARHDVQHWAGVLNEGACRPVRSHDSAGHRRRTGAAPERGGHGAD